jgi:hypothetical protein
MAEIKTKKTNKSVTAFVNGLEDGVRKTDAKILYTLMKRVTGESPKMWGEHIVGYGEYHYTSDRSTQEGDWPMVGFSPRKSAMSIYVMPGLKKYPLLTKKLGKHRAGVSCLYIRNLKDVDMGVLEELIRRGYEYMKQKHAR